MSIVLGANGEMKRYQAGEVVEEGRYYFEHDESDENGLPVLSMYIGTGDGTSVLSGLRADTLILDYAPRDGPQQIYARRR